VQRESELCACWIVVHDHLQHQQSCKQRLSQVLIGEHMGIDMDVDGVLRTADSDE